METKASLNAQLAAAQKKHGAKSQAAGRIQYKLNQLNKDSKGTAVKTKTGVLKSKTGVVRQNDESKKVRTITKRKTPLTGSPSAGTGTVKIKGSPIKKKIAANSGSKTKKITPNSGSKGNIQPVKLNKITLASAEANRKSKQQKQKQIQAANNASIAAANKAAAKKKAAKKEAKRQNDAIEKMVSRQDAADLRTKRSKTGVDNRNAFAKRVGEISLAKMKATQSADDKAAKAKAKKIAKAKADYLKKQGRPTRKSAR